MSNVVIDQPHILDTLSFRLLVERSVPQEDIKISVPVTVLLSKEDSDGARLSSSVREAMNQFMQAEWSMSNVQRDFDATGFERLTLTAHARVSVDENRNLHDRALAASRPGLMLARPTVSYALPPRKVSSVLEALRLEALADITRQLGAIGQATGRAWRLGHVQFGEDPRSDYRLTLKGARRNSGDEEDAEEFLAGSERITLAVDVTLKAYVA
jgi:hypothetical protein